MFKHLGEAGSIGVSPSCEMGDGCGWGWGGWMRWGVLYSTVVVIHSCEVGWRPCLGLRRGAVAVLDGSMRLELDIFFSRRTQLRKFFCLRIASSTRLVIASVHRKAGGWTVWCIFAPLANNKGGRLYRDPRAISNVKIKMPTPSRHPSSHTTYSNPSVSVTHDTVYADSTASFPSSPSLSPPTNP